MTLKFTGDTSGRCIDLERGIGYNVIIDVDNYIAKSGSICYSNYFPFLHSYIHIGNTVSSSVGAGLSYDCFYEIDHLSLPLRGEYDYGFGALGSIDTYSTGPVYIHTDVIIHSVDGYWYDIGGKWVNSNVSVTFSGEIKSSVTPIIT